MEKTVNDSLLEFMEFEKDFKIEELIGKLNEAQSTIDDLKSMTIVRLLKMSHFINCKTILYLLSMIAN